MKKFLIIFTACILTLILAACSENSTSGDSQPEPTPSSSQISVPQTPSSEPEDPEPLPAEPSSALSDEEQPAEEEETETNMLVAYFSYAENADLPDDVDASASASIQAWNGEITGNTGVVAAMIAEATGADLFSIQTVEKYPDTYDATINQGQEERNQDARPELASHLENTESYDVIFLGFPNWWGDMPMAVYSFLDEVDLSGKTIVPFVTSGGSGFSNTIRTIESLESGAAVQQGLSVSASSAAGAQDQVNEWLSGLGYAG